jgi:hypothetical protein
MGDRLPLEPAALADLCRRHGIRKVDLRTGEDLSRYFREEVVRSAEAKYVAG